MGKLISIAILLSVLSALETFLFGKDPDVGDGLGCCAFSRENISKLPTATALSTDIANVPEVLGRMVVIDFGLLGAEVVEIANPLFALNSISVLEADLNCS